MAILKILRCKNCTAPLPAGTTTCPKCHAVNLVHSEVNPLHLPSNLTNDYIEYFKQQTDANPKDTNALFGMGLVSAWACMIAHNMLLFTAFMVCYISGKWNPMNRNRSEKI